MTTVERFDDATTSWVEITQYESWKITNGLSDVLIAPTAQLGLPRTSEVAAGTRLRIRENTTTTFEGNVVRTKPRSQSAMRVDVEHDAYGLFEENVSLNVTGTDEDVLQAALTEAGGSWTLSYTGTATSLGDTYDVEGRSVKRVFRDMVDRVGRVWWVDVDHTIHVQPLGYRGTFASVDTSQDDAVVSEYTPDDVDTVVNDATVVGTGGEKVTGSAEDSGSISDYGRQPERTNVSYITTTGEANSYASELLNPQPDSSATVRVGASVGDVASPIVNYTLDVTDAQGVGLDDELVVEKQTVSQGSAELELGEGAGVNIAKFNRREKSKEDVTEPGSVYNSDRIADEAVIESKLQDLSVTLNKVDFDAIDETKIQDGAVRTPQLFAQAVTAEKLNAELARAERLLAGSIQAADIDTLDLDTNQLTIGADADSAIQFNTLTTGSGDFVEMVPGQASVSQVGTSSQPFSSMHADRVVGANATLEDGQIALSILPDGTADVIRAGNPTPLGAPDTAVVFPQDDDTGQVGYSGNAFAEMHAYEYIDASTGTAINDGGDPRAGLQDGHGPPESAKLTDESGGEKGYSLNRMARTAWDVIREQDRVITELEDTVERLEARIDELDPNA